MRVVLIKSVLCIDRETLEVRNEPEKCFRFVVNEIDSMSPGDRDKFQILDSRIDETVKIEKLMPTCQHTLRWTKQQGSTIDFDQVIVYAPGP
jgi:hypothetical protein